VPQHWPLEVTNVLLAAEASPKKKAAESTEFLALLGKLAIESDSETGPYVTTATIAYVNAGAYCGYPLARATIDVRSVSCISFKRSRVLLFASKLRMNMR
jgi:hypothetical protein